MKIFIRVQINEDRHILQDFKLRHFSYFVWDRTVYQAISQYPTPPKNQDQTSGDRAVCCL